MYIWEGGLRLLQTDKLGDILCTKYACFSGLEKVDVVVESVHSSLTCITFWLAQVGTSTVCSCVTMLPMVGPQSMYMYMYW